MVVVGAASLIPIRLADSWAEVDRELRLGLTLTIADPTFTTLAERLLAFLPLGFLSRAWFVKRGRGRSALRSGIAVALFALGIEGAQLLVSQRHAFVSDFVFATCSGVVGGLFAGGRQASRRGAGQAAAGCFGLAVFIVVATLACAHSGNVLADWDEDYLLAVGNEATADVPWAGRIRGFAIYDRGLSDDEIRELSATPLTREHHDVRERLGAIAAFVFDRLDGIRIRETFGGRPREELELAGPGVGSAAGHHEWIETSARRWIRSVGPPRRIVARIVRTGAFTVEAVVASANPEQRGPARILTNSEDPYHRNFTLGEDRGRLVFRVRTPRNGENGNRMELRSESPVVTGDWQHLSARFHRGTARLFVDGNPLDPPLVYHTWFLVHEDWPVRTGLFLLPLFIAMGAIAVVLQRSARPPAKVWLIACCATTMVPVLVSVASGLLLGRDLDVVLITTAVLGPIPGTIAGFGFRRLSRRGFRAP